MIGMKISKTGFNIEDASNTNLIFSSELATHSIYTIVSLHATSPAATQYTITHNLGYPPKVWAMAYDTAGSYYYRIPYRDAGVLNLDYWITDNTVEMYLQNYFPPQDFKIIIFTRTLTP